jgi:hypothetical protein
MPIAEHRQELYQSMGEAITAWVAVEDQLANLFAYFIAGDAQSLTAKAAFHAVISFSTKRSMMEDAAEVRISGDHLKRWKTLSNRVGRKSKKRNDIVHFAIIREGPFPAGPFSFYLSPSLQNVAARMRAEEPPRIGLKDIRQRAQSFRVLASDLGMFAAQIVAVPPRRRPEFLALLLGPDADSTANQ